MDKISYDKNIEKLNHPMKIRTWLNLDGYITNIIGET